MYYKKIQWWLALVILAQGYHTIPALASTNCEPVTPGQTDWREYCALELENGIKALLISNPDGYEAQLVVNVNAGSFQDPEGTEGLAHFLEHMLFLGSAQYPDVEELNNFLSNYSGSQNAFTSDSNTVYYYQIAPDAIAGLADRVSSAFIEPLLTADYIERETQAVHAEHSNNLQSDARRQQQIIRSLANKKHPFNGFSTGNQQTLNHSDIQSRLKQFFEQYYRPSKTTLSIQSNQPLAELADLVRASFGRIPKPTAKAATSPPTSEPIFEAGTLPMLVKTTPVGKETRNLTYHFFLPRIDHYSEHTQDQALNYISHLLGTEAEHSFAYWLQQQGLSKEMLASNHANEFYNQITIQISLTPKGVGQIQNISTALFEYLGLLQKNAIESWRFAEITRLNQWNFNYSINDSLHQVISTTFMLQKGFKAPNMLQDAYVGGDFEPEITRQFLEQLNTKNLLVSLIAPKQPQNRVETIYQTPYYLEALPAAQALMTVKQEYQPGYFQLPKTNLFLPGKEVVETKPIPKKVGKPTLIVDQPTLKLWYGQHQKLKAPLASLHLNLKFSQSYSSAKNAMLANLLAEHITEQLKSQLYSAIVAGMEYSIQHTRTGLVIKIEGYRPSVHKLLAQILPAITDFELDDNLYEQLVFQAKSNYENLLKATVATETAFSQLYSWILIPFWTIEERLAALAQLQPTELKDFAQTFKDQMQVEALYYGHLQVEQTTEIINLLNGFVPDQPTNDTKLRQYTAQKEGSFYVHQLQLNSPNSASALVFQLDEVTLQKGLQLAMLNELLKKPFFFELRTKQQLGYVVFNDVLATEQEIQTWIAFYVQSPNQGPVYLKQQILAFLKNFRQGLPERLATAMPFLKDTFKDQIRSTLEDYRQTDSLMWQLIKSKNWKLNLPEWQLAAIDAVTAEDLLNLYDRVFDEKSYRALAIELYSQTQKKQPPTVGQLVQNQAEYRSLTGKFEDLALDEMIANH